MIDWRTCRECGYPVAASDPERLHRECRIMRTIPVIVSDLKGDTVYLSSETRRALAQLIAEGAAYIYQAGTDPLFYNVWLENEIDPESPMGYRGVRKPLADWGNA